MRKQFTFYSSFWEAVQALPDEYCLASLRAIISYALTGEEPPVDGVAKAMFEMARPTLDISRRKAESGSLGGTSGTGESKDRSAKNDPFDLDSASKPQANASKSQANHKQTQANHKQTASKKEIEYEIEIENESSPPVVPPKGAEMMPKGFDVFWQAYPKKVGKQAAQKSFAKAIKTVSLQTLLAAVERQKRSLQWSRDNGQYIPNPATWLNQGRWDDEETEVTQQRSTNNVFARLVMEGKLDDA